jgi:hypothetical protein
MSGGDLHDLWRAMLQQQSAMLQVHAESLRLQRLIVDRLVGVPTAERADAIPQMPCPAEAPVESPLTVPPVNPTLEEKIAPTVLPDSNVVMEMPSATTPASETVNTEPQASEEVTPAKPAVNQSRTSRYYQARPSQGAPSVRPEELELMRRLQAIRESSSLILQFGPFKRSTLAQVAIHHPEYVRQLVLSAQRPEVRAAAARLVAALDAAAERQRRPSRPGRHGRSA